MYKNCLQRRNPNKMFLINLLPSYIPTKKVHNPANIIYKFLSHRTALKDFSVLDPSNIPVSKLPDFTVLLNYK